MVTYHVDKRIWASLTDTERVARSLVGFSNNTNYCHIFPPSINWGLQPELIGHCKVSSISLSKSPLINTHHRHIIQELCGVLSMALVGSSVAVALAWSWLRAELDRADTK